VPQVCFATRGLYQPYLAPYTGLFSATWADAAAREVAGAAGLLFFALAAAYVAQACRSLMLASILVILYHAVTTALGQVTLLRYVAMVSPFLLVVTGSMLVTALAEIEALTSLLRAALSPGRRGEVGGR
jgi:hypothetical protein